MRMMKGGCNGGGSRYSGGSAKRKLKEGKDS